MINLLSVSSVKIQSAILAFTLVYTACTTLSDSIRPEGRVVERSKQTKPVWADAPTGQLIVNATEAKIHYYLGKQRDLPIAIKLAQTSAIESSFDAWKPSFDIRLKEYPQLLAAKNSKNEKEYVILLDQAARKTHSQAAQVEDIYFERVRIENPDKVPELQGVNEYFDVHVLVQLMPVPSDKLNGVLHQVFSSAKSADLKKAVKDLAPKAKLAPAPIKKK